MFYMTRHCIVWLVFKLGQLNFHVIDLKTCERTLVLKSETVSSMFETDRHFLSFWCFSWYVISDLRYKLKPQKEVSFYYLSLTKTFFYQRRNKELYCVICSQVFCVLPNRSQEIVVYSFNFITSVLSLSLLYIAQALQTRLVFRNKQRHYTFNMLVVLFYVKYCMKSVWGKKEDKTRFLWKTEPLSARVAR